MPIQTIAQGPLNASKPIKRLNDGGEVVGCTVGPLLCNTPNKRYSGTKLPPCKGKQLGHYLVSYLFVPNNH